MPWKCPGYLTVGLSVVNGGNFAEIDTFVVGASQGDRYSSPDP
jgi:hypothetical protein